MNLPHTHELRHLNKGVLYTHVKGTIDDCIDYLNEIATKRNCGIALLINNCGYEVVNLEKEKLNKIKEAAPELFEALKQLINDSMANDFNEHWDSFKKAEALIKKLTLCTNY